MEGLGEFLRKGRERAGLSLDELAKRTRIRLENLESLEREDLDHLPSDTYVRGFVRQICREIGLPPQDGLARFAMLRERGGPPDEITWAEERAEESPGRLERALENPERVVRIARKGGRWAGLGLASLAVLALVIFAIRAVRPDGEPGASARGGRPGGGAAVGAKQTSEPEAPSGDRGQAPSATPREPAERAPESDGPTLTTSPSIALAAAREEDAAIRADTGGAPAVLPDVGEPAATDRAVAAVPAAGGRLVMEVEALEDVEVSVLLDGGGAPRRAALRAGERRRWKADDYFVLTVSDGGALRVFLDGADVGFAGERGRQTARTYRRQG